MIKRLFLLALPIALLAAACSSNGDDMPTDHSWMLTEIAGPDGDDGLAAHHPDAHL